MTRGGLLGSFNEREYSRELEQGTRWPGTRAGGNPRSEGPGRRRAPSRTRPASHRQPHCYPSGERDFARPRPHYCQSEAGGRLRPPAQGRRGRALTASHDDRAAARPGAHSRGGDGRAPRSSRAAAVRARRSRALHRQRARRQSHGTVDARGRHTVCQRLPPAARTERAWRGRAARARVRRPRRGPAGAPGAHLRRHGGRGARRRRLPRVLQERPQPLGSRVHRLPHAAPRPRPGARLPDGTERPSGSGAQSWFLGSAAEIRADPAGSGLPVSGARWSGVSRTVHPQGGPRKSPH